MHATDLQHKPSLGQFLEGFPHAMRTARLWSIMAPGVIAALFSAYALSFPFALTGIHGVAVKGYGYDDGVYLGSAIRLLHGDLPYRDFLFLHPPGITLLMSPVASLAGVFGAPTALAAARVVTVLVSAANASLAALGVRHRGPVAMLTAGLLVALYPAAIDATHTLLLEPYVVLFCLIGVTLLFKDGQLASGRRLLYAGLALGFACSIKLSAVSVLIAVAIVLAVFSRKALALVSSGAVAGFVVVCLPFLVAAPAAFFSNVFLVQFKRGEISSSVLSRLRGLTGADASAIHIPDVVVVVVAGVFLTLIVFRVIRDRHEFSPCDWGVIAAFAATTAACFATAQFYTHYSYLPAVWIAMTIALFVPGELTLPVRREVLVALLAVLCAVIFGQNVHHARTLLAGSFTVAGVVDEAVPPGACLLVDVTTFSIVAERFSSTNPDCPLMIDPFGEWVTRTDAHRPYVGVYPQSFVSDFADKLNSAAYVAFAAPYSTYVPWTPELGRWFTTNFEEIRRTPTVVVYAHSQHAPPPKQFPSMMSESADQLVALGIASEKSGDVGSAFDYYRAAINRDPGNKYAHFDIGHLAQVAGRADQAEAEYQTALKADPTFVEALYNLAVLKADADPAAAMDLYRGVLEVQPDHAGASFNLGVLLCRAGDESGKDLIRNAIALKPDLARDVPPDISLG